MAFFARGFRAFFVAGMASAAAVCFSVNSASEPWAFLHSRQSSLFALIFREQMGQGFILSFC